MTSNGQQSTGDAYLVDGTLYERAPAYVSQFGSEWVRTDVSENDTDVLRQYDRLGLHETVLANGTVSLLGGDEFDGTDVSVVRATANESVLASYANATTGGATVLRVNATYWIDQSNGTVHRIAGRNVGNTTARGQTVRTEATYDVTVSDEPVSITLPDAAEVAVSLDEGNRTE